MSDKITKVESRESNLFQVLWDDEQSAVMAKFRNGGRPLKATLFDNGKDFVLPSALLEEWESLVSRTLELMGVGTQVDNLEKIRSATAARLAIRQAQIDALAAQAEALAAEVEALEKDSDGEVDSDGEST